MQMLDTSSRGSQDPWPTEDWATFQDTLITDFFREGSQPRQPDLNTAALPPASRQAEEPEITSQANAFPPSAAPPAFLSSSDTNAQHISHAGETLPAAPNSAPLLRTANTSLDALMEQPQDMQRSWTVPAGTPQMPSIGPALSETLSTSWSQQGTENLGGLGSLHMQLQQPLAMPMGRLDSDPLSGGAAWLKEEGGDLAKASKSKATDPDNEAAHRQKNRDAQRRFRQRQRDNINQAQKAVDEMTTKLRDLAGEVQQERVNARVIMESLFIEDMHIKRLAANPEVRAAEQNNILNRFQNVINRIGRTDNVNEWTVKHWIEWFGKDYIPRLAELFSRHRQDPAANKEMQELISLRAENLARIARFSSWTWILYAWNVEATQAVMPHHRPGLEVWARLMVGLQLSRPQEDALLKAHLRLRQQLAMAASERKRVVSALEMETSMSGSEPSPAAHDAIGGQDLGTVGSLGSMESLGSRGSQGSQDSMGRQSYGGFQVEGVDWGPAGPTLRALRKNLEGERWAVLNFLYTILDQVLTPQQEAFLETHAYPWQADWHTMLSMLALKRQSKPITPEAVKSFALPDLSVSAPALQHLMPTATASQVLLQQLTVLGMGARLAYGIALCPYETVDSNELWRLPASSYTSSMPIRDAAAGKWQIGNGAPLYWFGLGMLDQDPYSLEPQDRARVKEQLSKRLGLLKV